MVFVFIFVLMFMRIMIVFFIFIIIVKFVIVVFWIFVVLFVYGIWEFFVEFRGKFVIYVSVLWYVGRMFYYWVKSLGWICKVIMVMIVNVLLII